MIKKFLIGTIVSLSIFLIGGTNVFALTYSDINSVDSDELSITIKDLTQFESDYDTTLGFITLNFDKDGTPFSISIDSLTNKYQDNTFIITDNDILLSQPDFDLTDFDFKNHTLTVTYAYFDLSWVYIDESYGLLSEITLEGGGGIMTDLLLGIGEVITAFVLWLATITTALIGNAVFQIVLAMLAVAVIVSLVMYFAKSIGRKGKRR